MSPKEYVNEEITKLKGLSFGKKIEYIWEYYKIWIIGITFSLILIISLITTIIGNSSKNSILHVVFLNTQMIGEDDTSLNDDFMKYAGLENTGSYLTLDLSMAINREENDMFSITAQQKLVALLATESLGTIISDESNFLFLADGGGYQSLDEVLSPELLEKYESSLYYTETEEAPEKRPYGIYLNNSQALKKDGLYPDNVTPIFAIPVNAENTETAVVFLEFLLN